MVKKSIIFSLLVVFVLLFISCTGFNLFKPKDMAAVIKDLPPEQQVSTAQEALSSAETDEDYLNIGKALADEFSDELSDGADNETEAEAAEIIATAYIQASPVGDIIGEIANAQSSGEEPDLENIFNNLASSEDEQESLVLGILNGATFTNYAADYDASESSEPDVDLQLTNAILNIGAAIIYNANVTSSDEDGNGTVDSVGTVDVSDAIENSFDENGNLNVTDPDAQNAVNEAKASLQEITNTINDPNDPVYQLADSILNMLP